MDETKDVPHLTQADLERLLSQEVDAGWTRLLLHHLEVCPECGRTGGWLLDLHRSGRLRLPFGPLDLALERSRAEAAGLWGELSGLSREERLRLAGREERFASWGLAELLCRESRAAAPEDAARAVELAEFAVTVADRIPEGEPFEDRWIYQLRASAWAHLGNAWRVQGDLQRARKAFETSMSWWEVGVAGTGDVLGYEAVLLDLLASLRTAQRRFPEALELLDRVVEIRLHGDPEHRDAHLAGRALIQKASAEAERGNPESAIAILREAAPLVDAARDPRLGLCLRHNLLDNLSRVGRFREAAEMLPEVREWSAGIGNRLDQVRLLWTEGRIAAGTGRTGEAVALFDEVRRELAQRGMAFDTALASLELAALHAEEGRTAEVKELARGIVEIFKAQEVHREALAAALIFRRAAVRERATARLAREVAAFLDQARHAPELRFAR
jgi:tetratricopeptide (TPR) repeat protein